MLECPIFSAETYVAEPPDLWERRIEKRFAADAPRVEGEGDARIWCAGGKPMIVAGDCDERDVRFDGTALLDPSAYAGRLEKDGVSGAALYPTAARRAYGTFHGERLSAVLRAYNDWILEYCGAHPDRLRAVAMLNVEDAAEAARELERTAARGAAAVLVPLMPHVERNCYDNPRYEPLWEAAAEAGLPVSLCPGTFHPAGPGKRALAIHVLGEDDRLHPYIYRSNEIFYVRLNLYSLLFAGTFSRHPRLKICVAGFGASWFPYTRMRCDEQYEVRPERAGGSAQATEVFEHYGLFPEGEGYEFPDGVKPSDQLVANVRVTFHDDADAIAFREHVGVDNLLWGAGRPAADPRRTAGERLAARLEKVPAAEKARIAGGNAARLYRL